VTPPPVLAVTIGDPRGIGPEITAAVAGDAELEKLASLRFVGPGNLLPGDGISVGEWTGGGDKEAGRLAGRSIERAVEMARAGEVRGIVTAPIHKGALRAAGWLQPGHTELLRDLFGVSEVGMLMAAERTVLGDAPLRTLLATTHLPLRAVPDAVTGELIRGQARLLDDALRRWWGIGHPRIALCALNPHASDGGLFGDEESRVMEPAVVRLRADGVDVTGPLPADTVFVRTLRGEFDAVIVPAHDVAMAAFKTVSFGAGVNVTLGLPVPRTSPDHGTAFDIAGRGIADASSMREAVCLAARLADRTALEPA
jgi:4-hydroxythreonine-4-phosphate dehydrogenase